MCCATHPLRSPTCRWMSCPRAASGVARPISRAVISLRSALLFPYPLVLRSLTALEIVARAVMSLSLFGRNPPSPIIFTTRNMESMSTPALSAACPIRSTAARLYSMFCVRASALLSIETGLTISPSCLTLSS